MFEVEFYKTQKGREPAIEFLSSLDKQSRAKCLMILELLEEKGNELREPFGKHLEEGIFELRAKTRGGAVRVLYFFYAGGKIIITNGFIKKTQKAPRKEIKLAKRYRDDYVKRNGLDDNL